MGAYVDQGKAAREVALAAEAGRTFGFDILWFQSHKYPAWCTGAGR